MTILGETARVAHKPSARTVGPLAFACAPRVFASTLHLNLRTAQKVGQTSAEVVKLSVRLLQAKSKMSVKGICYKRVS